MADCDLVCLMLAVRMDFILFVSLEGSRALVWKVEDSECQKKNVG